MKFIDQFGEELLGTTQGRLPGSSSVFGWIKIKLKIFRYIGKHTISSLITIDAIDSGEPQLLQSIHLRFFSVRLSTLRITSN